MRVGQLWPFLSSFELAKCHQKSPRKDGGCWEFHSVSECVVSSLVFYVELVAFLLLLLALHTRSWLTYVGCLVAAEALSFSHDPAPAQVVVQLRNRHSNDKKWTPGQHEIMPEQQPLLMTNQPQQPHAEKAKVKIDLKSTSKKSVDFANNNNHQISSDHVQQPHQQPTSQTPTNSSSRDLSQVSTSLCFTYFWDFF